jgi:hypothetical protein
MVKRKWEIPEAFRGSGLDSPASGLDLAVGGEHGCYDARNVSHF